jgi:hypothetical protein
MSAVFDARIDEAQRLLPDSHTVVAIDGLRSLIQDAHDVAIAETLGVARAASVLHAEQAYRSGYTAAARDALRIHEWRWLLVAALVVISFIIGRQSILWQAGL